MNSKSDTMDAEIKDVFKKHGILPPNSNPEVYGNHLSIIEPVYTALINDLQALLLRERIESEYKGKRKMLRRMVVKGYLEDTKAVAWLTVIEAERNKELSRLSGEESHE